MHLGLAGFVLLMILVSSSIMILPQHFSRTLDIQMPLSNIGNVSVGQDVKIYGQIDSSRPIAFVLIFRDDHWQLQFHAEFNITDARGGRILPDVTGCHDFFPKFHNLSDKDHSQYRDGDNVTVFGKVGETEDGKKTLEVRRIYPGAKDPYELMPGWYQTLWLIPAVALILLLQVLVIYGHRRWLHRRYQDKRPESDRPNLDAAPDDPDIVWNKSPLLENEKRTVKRLSAGSIILFIVILALSALVPWVWEDSPVPMVIACLVLVFTVTFAFLSWEMTHSTPVAIGTSEKALYLKFRPRKISPDQILPIPWARLERYTSNIERRRVHFKFFSEKRIDYAILPRESLKMIDAEYSKRKHPAA
jgi:hypothetical protein